MSKKFIGLIAEHGEEGRVNRYQSGGRMLTRLNNRANFKI